MGRSKAGVLVRRGSIEGHTRPPGGEFAQRALIPSRLTPLLSSFLGIHCVDTADRAVALTYDDGPHPEHTPRILDVLADHQASATFFVLTPAARAQPGILRRMLDEGHRIGLHGADHRSLLTMSTRAAVRAVAQAKDELEQLAGTPVTHYRPPYGHHTPSQAWALRRLGLELVLWSGDGMDWVDQPAADVVERVAASAFPGGILLMHDDRADPETLQPGESLPAFDRALVADHLLQRLAAERLTIAPLEEMLARAPHVFSGSRERMRRR